MTQTLPETESDLTSLIDTPPVEIDPGKSDWIRDRDTGEMRPRKRRGRKPAAQVPPMDHAPIERAEDVPPDAEKPKRGRKPGTGSRYKSGIIAPGMAKLYKRVGRILQALGERDIGVAMEICADDCGEAWDDLAKVNPRVRATLLKLIAGGTYGNLIMAHAPIFLAIAMKERIRTKIPFMKLFGALSDDSGDGMTEDDMAQAMGVAERLMSSFIPETS